MARQPHDRRPPGTFGRNPDQGRPSVPKRGRKTGSRKVRQIAARGQPKVQRSITAAVQATKKKTSETAIRNALEQGDVDRAVRQVPWQQVGEPMLRADFGRAFRAIFETAGEVTADQVGSQFAVVDSGAADFLQQHGGKLINEFGGLSREELRARLVQMSNEGLSVRDAAKLFKDEIGLTQRQHGTLAKYRADLTEKGLNADRLARAIERKTAAMLRHRAETIAQTEAQFAATAGQQAAWKQAVEQGLLDADRAEREWITTDKPCVQCDPLDGVRVGLDEPWVLADGTAVDGPPAHPWCLCAVILHANARAEAA